MVLVRVETEDSPTFNLISPFSSYFVAVSLSHDAAVWLVLVQLILKSVPPNKL